MIKHLNKLNFFNSIGNKLDFAFDEELNLFTGTLYFRETSSGLIQNETLHILEECILETTGDVAYDKPKIGSNLEIYFKNNYFNLFTVDNPYEETPFISILSETKTFWDKTLIVGENEEHNILSKLENKSQKINILFKTAFDGVFNDVLILRLDGEIIAEIGLYIEVSAEDKRFVNKLADFGEYIAENEEYIFRNSNISEDNPNYNILNKKRKEYLIELHNIKPYFSSYKGILNILNLFDFGDLRLKEYWYDTKNKKFILEDINLYEKQQLDNPDNYNPDKQKTTFFGLFYNINKVVEGEYDENGLPITEDNFLYSNEEILIKLYGLKNWIKDREIGGVCTIIDIVGEVTFFNKYLINFWYDEQTVDFGSYGDKVDFDVESQDKKEICYIQDLRSLLDNWSLCELDRENGLKNTTVISLFDKCYLGWFEKNQYSMNDPSGHDEPNIPVGGLMRLKNQTFNKPWNEISSKWNETTNEITTFNISWKNSCYFQFYEMRWRVIEDKTGKTILDKTGKIQDINSLDNIILPFVGTYSVELTLYKFNNENVKLLKSNIIECRIKNADMLSYFRFTDYDLQKFISCDLSWNKVHCSFSGVVTDNSKYAVDENKIRYVTSNLLEYMPLDNLDYDLIGLKGISWNTLRNSGNSWNDLMYQSWKDTVYNGMKLSHFIIKNFITGGELQLNNESFVVPDGTNIMEYSKMVRLLNDIPLEDFSSFRYVPRTYGKNVYIEMNSKFIRSKKDILGSSSNIFIEGYKNRRSWKDYETDITWKKNPIKWKNAVVVASSESKDYPFTLDNTRVYSDYFDAPIMSNVFFTIDNSEMCGKTHVSWKVIRENISKSETLLEIEGINFLNYQFLTPGQYSVEVEITDTNGNKNKINKNKIINILDVNKFKSLGHANK